LGTSAVQFQAIKIENCKITGGNGGASANCFIRGNRGAAANTQKIGKIEILNSIIHNFGNNGSSNYYTILLDKLQFTELKIEKSTLYNTGAGLISASTVLAGAAPTVSITNSTINGFGGSNRFVLFDANANPIHFTLKNSIIANSPQYAVPTQTNLLRSTGAAVSTSISNSNYFNLYNDQNMATRTKLLIPNYVSLSNNQEIALNWSVSTTDFNLPADSPLRKASAEFTAIGDPRWAY